jgi:predicted nucleic acid-binding Zn ribbon protein
MPLYEYEATEDGEIVTLLRPMSQADAPVEDPAGKGRTFRRRHSVFGVGGASTSSAASVPISGGCCPCGVDAGQCGRLN